MTDLFVAGKRTRSQLAVPDDVLKVAQRSPMKDARMALKNQATRHGSNPPSQDGDQDPAPDEARRLDQGDGVDAEEQECAEERDESPREPKKRKFTEQQFPIDLSVARPILAIERTNSDPSGSPRRTRPEVKESRSTSPRPTGLTPSAKDRAASMPPFWPTAYVPHIDFTNPPPSPTRPKSRSPSKERLRIEAGAFPPIPRLSLIRDDSPGPSRNEESDAVASINNPNCLIPPPTPVIRPPFHNTPFTPATQPIIEISMSPLTPIPPTPMPPRQPPASRQLRLEATIFENGSPAPKLAGPSTLGAQPKPITITTKTKSRAPNNPAILKSTSGLKTTKNAFHMMMGQRVKGSPLGKVKERMKAREKPKPVPPPPALVPEPEEDNDAMLVDEPRTQPEPIPTAPDLPLETEAPGPSETVNEPQEPAKIDQPATQTLVDNPTSPLVDEPATEDILTETTEEVESVPVEKSAATPPIALEPVLNETADSEPLPTQIAPTPAQKAPKPALGKKRGPTSIPSAAPRVTRSASSKQKEKPGPAPSIPTRRIASTSTVSSLKRTASGTVKKGHVATRPPVEAKDKAPDSKAAPQPSAGPSIAAPPISPTKPSAVAPTPKPSQLPPFRFGSAAPSGSKTPARPTSLKPQATPSPTKIARTHSMFGPRQSIFSGESSIKSSLPVPSSSSSTLSTLSTALERLKTGHPPRPNTSLGFNPGQTEATGVVTKTQDDTGVGTRRSITTAAPSVKDGGSKPSGIPASRPPTVQQSVTAFMAGNKARPFPPIPAGRGGASLRGRPIFVGVGVPRKLASKTPSLPVVIGSPVKAGESSEATNASEDGEPDDGKVIEAPMADEDIFMDPPAPRKDEAIPDEQQPKDSGKGKGKERADDERPSRRGGRVSMVSQALSQSLSQTESEVSNGGAETKGMMGPPPTPPAKRARGGSSASPSSSPSHGQPLPIRASKRIAKAVSDKPQLPSPVATSSKKEPPAKPATEGLKLLKDCKVFVDVKTDGGDEAGTVFVGVLETLGAKVLTRVGTTCTHIVFKNGQTSTVTKYRIMDPKPLVVGIAWVVECAEKRVHADETPFLVNLDNVNIAGGHKRRRSVLPKFMIDLDVPEPSTDEAVDGDVSMDGSQSSINLDDDLPPLERARRRKLLAGTA